MYEENSLGIYPEEEEDNSEDALDDNEKRVQIWGRHLVRHLRHQLSFGTLRRVLIYLPHSCKRRHVVACCNAIFTVYH